MRKNATGTVAPLFHQKHRAAALDFPRDFTVHVCRHSGNATRQDFATFGNELFQQIWILVIDRLDRDVDTAPRHGSIGAAKGGTAFCGFRLHGISAFRDAGCAASKMDCISFSRVDSVCADSSCSVCSCNARPACPKLSLPCIRG